MQLFSMIKKGSVHLNKEKILKKAEVATLLSIDELLQETKQEREEILQEARDEGEKIKQAQAEEGFQQGLETFNTQLVLFEEHLKVLKHEMQKAMLPLVLTSIKRIIGDELKLHPESVVNIIMQGIKNSTQAKLVKLFVNKKDIDYIEEKKDTLKGMFENLESFHIEEREDISEGSCIIETEKGIINATLENQFKALEKAFERK